MTVCFPQQFFKTLFSQAPGRRADEEPIVPDHDAQDKVKIAQVQLAAESWSPQQVLAWAFGTGGMVLIDMASRLRKDFRVFTLDTEFLFPETYSLIDTIESKYEIKI